MALGFPPWLAAQPSDPPTLSVEQRLDRRERQMTTQGLVEILQHQQRLQRELQELRGEAELHNHALQQIKEHQRELYLDLDRRLRRLETAMAGAAQTESMEAVPQNGPSGPPEGTDLTAGDAVSSVAPLAEQASYQAAFDLLKEGHYQKAIEGLKVFLETYPQGTYAGNAQYWLGEAYYVTRQYEAAMQAFQRLQEAYPKSPKVSHAELKIGYIHYELGQMADAERILTSLVTRYPNAAVGRLAQERLERMQTDKR